MGSEALGVCVLIARRVESRIGGRVEAQTSRVWVMGVRHEAYNERFPGCGSGRGFCQAWIAACALSETEIR